jgi:hypothetical protein
VTRRRKLSRVERARRERRQERRARRREAERSSRIVCEKCGLEQPFRSGDDVPAPCARGELLDLPCNGETAITAEAYALGEF